LKCQATWLYYQIDDFLKTVFRVLSLQCWYLFSPKTEQRNYFTSWFMMELMSMSFTQTEHRVRWVNESSTASCNRAIEWPLSLHF
jgi:hypothetical protein